MDLRQTPLLGQKEDKGGLLYLKGDEISEEHVGEIQWKHGEECIGTFFTIAFVANLCWFKLCLYSSRTFQCM